MRWRWDWRARYHSILIVDDSVAGRSDAAQYASELRWAFAGSIARALVALAFAGVAWRERDVAVLPWMCGAVLLVQCAVHVSRVTGIVSRQHLLLRAEEGQAQLLAMRALALASVRGVRPRVWDPAIVARLQPELADQQHQVGAHLLAYTAALDDGDLMAAEQLLVSAASLTGPKFSLLQSNIAREAAFLAARIHNDPAAARQWLQRARYPALERGFEQRVEAAVLLAEGQPESALATARAALGDTDTWIDIGGGLCEMDLLRAIEADCLRAMGSTQPHAETV
jgi:hypothetical protein